MVKSRERRSIQAAQDVSNGYDELNLGRLALISGQKSVPDALRRWEKSILTPDGRPVIITCSVPDGFVVPHGLDNDFMVGLINLCFEAGLPDGVFTATGYQLLKASGFPDSAQYYRAMEGSLMRLNKASYTVDEGWFLKGPHTWTTQSFAQVSYLSFQRADNGIRSVSAIHVQLAPPIMESLRAGFIKPLDVEFYRSLSQPLVRAVYRQLDAVRFDENSPDGLKAEVGAPLMGWANRLGLLSDRPDNVQRTLTPAHDELLKRGYLQAVEYTGRGKVKEVRYVFGAPPTAKNPELVALLTERGVKQGMAVRLSTVFSERIEEAVRRFDHYSKNPARPITNRGGLLVAMVQRPEDFADLPGYVSPQRRAVAAERSVKVKRAQEREAQAQEAQAAAVVETMGLPELLAWALRQLSVTGVLKQFAVRERTLLGEGVLEGRIDARALVREATLAVARGAVAVQLFVEQTRAHLND